MSTDAPSIEEENRSAATAFAGTARYVASPANVDSRPGFFSSLPWPVLMIVVGFATIAACVLVPLREENQLLAHDLANLQSQAKYVQDQVSANSAFLERVNNDPTLANRLLMRMTNKPIPGTAFLEAASEPVFASSPYEITRITPPAPSPAYQSTLPASIRSLFSDFRSRSILMCAGIFLVAAAVVLGSTKEKTPTLT